MRQNQSKKDALKIAVLKGGWSAEREVSLVSGRAAAAALAQRGYQVEEIDVSRALAEQLRNSFNQTGPDIAFNALHGKWGEDGSVQGLLEVMGLAYTHSGVGASALAFDKNKTKDILMHAGLPVPEGQLISADDLLTASLPARPCVVKPNAEGSSVNVFIIRDGDNRPLQEMVNDPTSLRGEFLVEAFIPGRELTTAVMGERALAVTEIIAHNDFYDYEAKYADGGSSHVVPADIPEEIAQACLRMAAKAHQVLGCRGLSRTDFRWDESRGVNGLFILEVNTQPGLTPTSLAPEQAAALGISFSDLCDWMVKKATTDHEEIH
ncbi:MAG: D-alanine--D-alanine ligase [bacterium]